MLKIVCLFLISFWVYLVPSWAEPKERVNGVAPPPVSPAEASKNGQSKSGPVPGAKDLTKKALPTPPCSSDIEKFCSTVQKGGHAITQCLKKNSGELSTACKRQLDLIESKIQSMRAKYSGIKEACKPDVERFCKTVAVGKGQRMKCLKAQINHPEFSAACKLELEKVETK